jgi:hypothetical protein
MNFKGLFVIAVCLFFISSSGTDGKAAQKHQKQRKHHANDEHPREFRRDFVSRSKKGALTVTKVARRGVYTIQTQTSDLGEKGLLLREITNGRKLIQAVYDGPERLVDCDILPDRADVVKFVQKFFHGVYKPGVLQTHLDPFKNATYSVEPIKGSAQRHQYRSLTDFRKVKLACKSWMLEQKEYFKREKHIDLDHLNQASLIGQEGDKDRDTQNKQHKAATDEAHHSRSKRSMWIYPGTKWCGHGNMSKGYSDLGVSIDTDKCCRQHDHCPTTITGFTTAFNYFNFRFNTLSHCHCDTL